MKIKAEISSLQFYTVLFLGRVFALVTYIMSMRTELASTDRVISSLLAGLYMLATAIPLAVLIRQNSSSSVLERAEKISPLLGKVLCVVYFAELIYLGVITSVRFGIFTGSVMFPDTNIMFFIFMMLAFSAFTAFRGIEGLGRSAFVMLFPVLLSLIFVFSAQSGRGDILNMTVPLASSAEGIVSTAVFTASRTGELLFIALIPQNVKKQKSSHIFIFILCIAAVMVASELVMSLVLGSYGATQLYGMYSLSVLARLGFIERLDAFFSCVWLLCAGIRCALTLFTCSVLLRFFTKKSRNAVYICLCAVLIFLGALPLSGNLIGLSWLINAPVTQIFYLLGVVVIPLTVMLCERVKKREKA